MELDSIMLSEISQTEKHKHSVITYMWNLKKIKQMSVHNNRKRLTDTESKLVVTSGAGRKGMGKKQGRIVQHREIKSLSYNNFEWSISYTTIETLWCTPETNVIL